MNAIGQFLFSIALLALCSGCACAEPPTPLLWKVSDADNHVYLLGSFHALKASDYPLATAVDAAFDDASTVVFEISPEEMNSPELSKKISQAATLNNGKTLQATLSARSWHQLEMYSNKRNLPLKNFEHMEPWFVSMVISMTEVRLLGYEAQYGLDRALTVRAEKAAKPTQGLETGDEQIAALDSMTATEQQQTFAEALDGVDKLQEQMDRMHAQWHSGNEQALFNSIGVELKTKYPQLYQRINVMRNQAWLPKIQRMLDDESKQNILVVVGSLHLLGPDGLVAQLKAKGYSVERL